MNTTFINVGTWVEIALVWLYLVLPIIGKSRYFANPKRAKTLALTEPAFTILTFVVALPLWTIFVLFATWGTVAWGFSLWDAVVFGALCVLAPRIFRRNYKLLQKSWKEARK